MLSFEAILADGGRKPLEKILAAELKRELEVPADSLSLSIPYESGLCGSIKELEVTQDGTTVFLGRIDEAVNLCTDKGAVIRLSARSYAAALLDSEAEPRVYTYPSAELIFRRHLLPFGITECRHDRQPLYNSLQINKGMSHWQVIARFCRDRYGVPPRIEGRRAYLDGYDNPGSVTFGKNGVPYLSISESRRRHKLITSVAVRFKPNTGYVSVVKNKNPECEGLDRVRYIDMLTERARYESPESVLENSNLLSYRVTLRCRGCLLDALGKKAVIRDDRLGELDGLKIEAVSWRLSEKGEESEVRLGKEKV